jgi:hypothetical protein
MKSSAHSVSELRPGADDDVAAEGNATTPPQALEENLSFGLPLRFRLEVHERASAATLVIRTGRLAPRRRWLENLDRLRAHEVALAIDRLDE